MKGNLRYILLFVLCALYSCSTDDNQKLEERSWQLVWEDNFEGAAGQLVNPSNWSYDIGTDWGNAQLEYDTDRAKNVSLDGSGNLAIVAFREGFSGSGFTSGRINTKGKFEHQYGRIEARMKLPYGPGIWPAFWLLGSNIDDVGWPQCGEIDIMELRGQQPNIIHGSVHGPGYSAGEAITASFGFADGRFDTNFHILAVEWFDDKIDFFVDDILYQRITPDDVPGLWVFDQPYYIILNLAVGGNYVGFPTDDTPFPQTMLVDYVRVYRLVNGQ